MIWADFAVASITLQFPSLAQPQCRNLQLTYRWGHDTLTRDGTLLDFREAQRNEDSELVTQLS